MSFTSLLNHENNDRPCILDDRIDVWLTFAQFHDKASEWREQLPGPKALVFLYLENSIECVASLFGAVAAGHAVALLDPSLPLASREKLNEHYRPDFVLSGEENGKLVATHQPQDDHIDPELTILLSTSGSTGSPKFVRLTADNLILNAKAIASTLGIEPGDVACAHLPLHYSFGLSVLTSHLMAGAAVRLTESGFTDRIFWSGMKEAGVTHLPGVPFHFQMLERLRYERIDLPALKSMAQAGGFLEIASRTKAHDYMSRRAGRFYVMYGQTEAAPRMTTLAHDDFSQSPASVGNAVPGGKIRILDDKAQELSAGQKGDVEYSGPNVMLGYAQERADLSKGDRQHGSLMTGDIGFLDEAGRLTLVGRAKRSTKVYGLRVNLDEVEGLLTRAIEGDDTDIAVTQRMENLVIHYLATDEMPNLELEERAKRLLADHFTLPKSCFKFSVAGEIPRTARGKIDYQQLEQMQ